MLFAYNGINMKLNDVYLGDIINFSQKNEFVSGLFEIEEDSFSILLGDLDYLIEINNGVHRLYTPVNGLPGGIDLGVEVGSGELDYLPSNMIYYNNNLAVLKYRKLSFFDKKRFAYIFYLDTVIVTFLFNANLYRDDITHTKIKRGSQIKKAIVVSAEVTSLPVKI
jgi:hypothetical protein